MTLEEDKYEDEAIQTFIQTEGCTDSSTEDQQSCQPPPADQHTLQLLHRTNRNIPGEPRVVLESLYMGLAFMSKEPPNYHGKTPRNSTEGGLFNRIAVRIKHMSC